MNNHYERTMREERWKLSEELFAPDRPEPEAVIAFRLLQERDWMHFIESVENNPSLKFFNPEQREFSPAADWEELSKTEGITPFDDRFLIRWSMSERGRDFCREFRLALRNQSLVGHVPPTAIFFDPMEWPIPLEGDVCLVLRMPREVIEKMDEPSMDDLLQARSLLANEVEEDTFYIMHRDGYKTVYYG